MLAIEGQYDKGWVKLDEDAPVDSSRVIVWFPIDKTAKEEKLSTEDAMRLFHEFTGSIDRDFDYEKEKDEYFSEKYGHLG